MRIFIEPTEPLMFRTGRPFAVGINNFAESIFPPTPETIQGAVRAAIAAHWGQKQEPPIHRTSDIFKENGIVKLIGNRDTYGQFRITGLTLGRRNTKTQKIERLFPVPSHIIRATLKDESNKKFQRLVLLHPYKPKRQEITNMPSGYDLLCPMLNGQKTASKSEPLNEWLTPRGLSVVLHGDLPDENASEENTHLLKASSIYAFEWRVGIGMHDNKKITKEGYLFQTQMVRMQPGYGFVVDVAFGEAQYGSSQLPPTQEQHTDTSELLAFLSADKTGWLTLGGEQRSARFTVLEPQDMAEEEGISQKKAGNMLYFATPAYFKRGWLPEDQTLLPSQPITAAVNHYQPIGGWYLNIEDAGGGHKTMRRCIRAGSIYFFDKDEQITVQRPLTEYGWQIGYGITYTGEWK